MNRSSADLALREPAAGSGHAAPRPHRDAVVDRPPFGGDTISPPRGGTPGTADRGDLLTAISDGIVGLFKEFYGRGPTRAKTYYHDDLVVCMLRGGFSRVEQTLLAAGRGAAVIEQRIEFQDLMRDRFTSVIENATGQAVIGFMNGIQQDPDMMCEVFALAPSDPSAPQILRARAPQPARTRPQ